MSTNLEGGGKAILRYVDLSAGAGSIAIGLERAGYEPVLLVESELDFRETILANRSWPVAPSLSADDARALSESHVDLIVGNLPSRGISVAGPSFPDSNDYYSNVLRRLELISPRSAMFVNVSGLMHKRFAHLREYIGNALDSMGFQYAWRVIDSLDFGVPQSRRRSVLVAISRASFSKFVWPVATSTPPTVGEALRSLMAANGWPGADQWARLASGVAPTIVGGSRRHGGADLGPSRSKELWYAIGVDPRGIADQAPSVDTPTRDMPRLTNPMLAALQGYPPDWVFRGRKTSVYRQIASSFPPPVAEALALEIGSALRG